jgi:23S rRNA pseudouridine1911/1915/1917 synthase
MRAEVPAALDGERVDRAVAFLTGRPRSEVNDLIVAGAVRIQGRAVVNRSRKLRAGEVIDMDLPDRADPKPRAQRGIELVVVHEDDDVVVVDKPPGLVVHPGAGNPEGTMVNALLARYPEMESVGDPARPGIVHRLDKGTSGLLAVARTARAYESLVAQLGARTVDRRYLALVAGIVESDEGLVDAPVGRSERTPTLMAVSGRGREARTRYRVRSRHHEPVDCTLLECRLETGRTHQIRVHLSAIGHPVIGDARYNGVRAGLDCPRPFLHAFHLGFEHPEGHRVDFEVGLPADLGEVASRLS